MNELERALRRLGERARAELPRTGLTDADVRRIRARRIGTAVTALLSVLVIGTGVVFAASGLVGGRPTTPARPVPTPSDDVSGRCEPPPFVAQRVDGGPHARLLPGSGGGASVPGVIGHYAVVTRRGYIDLAVGHRRELFRQTHRERVEVLGTSASLGLIHEGYSVEFDWVGCEFTLMAYGLDRGVVRRFAESLVPRAGYSDGKLDFPEEQSVWPDDNEESARAHCGQQDWRRDPTSVALEFAADVLRWPEATSWTLTKAEGKWNGELRESPADDGPDPVGDAARVSISEVLPGCWSLVSVSRLPDRRPTGLSLRVSGRNMRIGFATGGAASARVEVGYGGRAITRRWNGSDGLVEIHLPFEPDAPGHVLILFEDGAGHVFSAASATLPPGDFAAG